MKDTFFKEQTRSHNSYSDMFFCLPNILVFNRYNISGFVEELPKLPENRQSHACAALPVTGVRLAQSIPVTGVSDLVTGGGFI